MSRFSPLALIALSGVLASGCASVAPDEAYADVQELLAERGVARIHWNQGTQADADVAKHVGELLQEELSVDAAVQVALLNNRALQATYEDLGIAQADLVQAGLLSNPIFHGEIRFPKSPHTPFELDISQDFLSVLFLPLRKRVAQAQLDAAKLRVADVVLDLAARTRTAFYTLQASQQLQELRQSVLAATEASADAAAKLREAGNITQLVLANERALQAQARLEFSLADEQVLAAREELTTLMGLWGAETQFRVALRLPDLPENEIPLEGMESIAVAQRLDLGTARAEVVVLARMLGLEKYAVLEPGLVLTAHLEAEPEGTKTSGPGLEIPLPLFDQGQAARAGARAMLRQGEQRYAALAVQVRSEVRRARNALLSARGRAEYCRNVLLPLRTSIVEETQLEYNGMLVGIFELLLAKQSEIDAGHTYIEALRDYWIARSQLERAAGGRLAESAPLLPEESRPVSAPEAAESQPQVNDIQHQHHGDPR